MSSDDIRFQFGDPNANQYYEVQGERHSPPALDADQVIPAERLAPNRPGKLHIPRQGSVDYSRFEDILKATRNSHTITDLSYHVRAEVKDALNTPKENRKDWRGVASRMGIKPPIIEKIEKNYKEDPTEKVLTELSDEKIKKFLQVLYQMDRHDVLNIFYEDIYNRKQEAYEKRQQFKNDKIPSQESTPNSAYSSASEIISPYTPKSPINNTPKDNGTPESAGHSDSGVGSTRSQLPQSRPKSGSFAKQHTDDDLTAKFKSALNFHSSESTSFWNKILPKPDAATKEWKKFEEVLIQEFGKESRQSQVMRFICYVLKIEPYEERHTKYVHDRDFANLVAWFGPVKTGKDGLFEKIAQLIKDSTTYKGNTGPHSFFAGYMTKDEADEVIGNSEKVGTFLIRFSSTYANLGSFVVCLKTDAGTEHVLLEGNPETGKISYNGKEYDDLVTLWRRGLSRGGVSQDRRTSCTTICPNLPLNAMFKPYGAGPRPAQGLGRGRGRGRGQEQ